MARIRSIKPEFWSNEQVMSCSPLARLMFIGLWNFCDDSGVHPLKPVSIKALVFPGDDIDSTSIRRALDELSSNDLIVLYEHGGKEYLQVTGWTHQRIDKPTKKYPIASDGNPIKSATCHKKIVEPYDSPRGVLVESSTTELELELEIDQNQDQKLLSKKQVLDGFDQFWKIYPRKESKANARKAWDKIKSADGLLSTILKSVEYKSGTHDWAKEGGKYIPLPASWLNAKRWEDEIPAEAPISVKAMNKIISIYNEVCAEKFQPASGITEYRASELSCLWHTKLDDQPVFQSPAGWDEYFQRCLKTNFSWVAKEEINFDFLISRGNVARVWECNQ